MLERLPSETHCYRDKHRTPLRDLIEVGLVDSSWCVRLPVELRAGFACSRVAG